MRSIVVSFKRIYKNLKPYFYFSNLVIFTAKGVLFLLTKSFLFIISSFYNLGIGLAKRKIYFNKINYASVGIFLVMVSMFFIIYSIWTIVMHKVVHYHIYSGITIATITFYDIGYSIYGIIGILAGWCSLVIGVIILVKSDNIKLL